MTGGKISGFQFVGSMFIELKKTDVVDGFRIAAFDQVSSGCTDIFNNEMIQFPDYLHYTFRYDRI